MTSFMDGPWGRRRETPAGLTWVALSSSVLHSRGFAESEATEMGGHVVWKGLLQVGLTRLSRARVIGDDVAMPKKYPLEFKKDMAGTRTSRPSSRIRLCMAIQPTGTAGLRSRGEAP